MKASFTRRVLAVSVLCSAVLEVSTEALADGIPEPGLTMYGVLRNDIGGAHVRVTSGSLSWTIVPPGGPPVTVATALRNINDQFSYVLEVPFETLLPGALPTTNALQLQVTATSYDRSNVSLVTNAATIVSGGTSFLFSRSDRARVERVDLGVAIAYPDRDGDGLPDFWEDNYFDGSADPNDDPDGDGLTNLEEYLSGCDPTDPASAFLFVNAVRTAGGAFTVTWSSQADRSYTLERSENLVTGYSPLQTGIAATPPENTFTDVTVSGGEHYFYRIVLE